NRDVQHGELFAQHELVLYQYRSQLCQTVADILACCILCARVGAAAFFQRRNVHEQFFLEVVEEETSARAHDGIGRHELGMREALVDEFVDDVGLVQDQVALHEDGHLPVRVHDG